jgi:hypothetical protein
VPIDPRTAEPRACEVAERLRYGVLGASCAVPAGAAAARCIVRVLPSPITDTEAPQPPEPSLLTLSCDSAGCWAEAPAPGAAQ